MTENDKRRDETVLSEPVTRAPRDLRGGMPTQQPAETAAHPPQPAPLGAHQPQPGWPAPTHPADLPAAADDGGVATLPPLESQPRDHSPIDDRTGQPKRPPLIWIAGILPFAGTAVVGVAIGLIFWDSIPNFKAASWVNGTMDTDPGSWVRVAFSVINAVIAAVVGGSAAFLGYNIFTGKDWTRIGGIVATVVACAALMLTPLAAAAIAPVAIAAALTWLPGCRRFFNAWTAFRRGNGRQVVPPPQIHYGPLPRYL